MTESTLRDALKELKRYCSGYVDGDGSEDEQLAYDDIHIRLSQILAEHPAEPAHLPNNHGESVEIDLDQIEAEGEWDPVHNAWKVPPTTRNYPGAEPVGVSDELLDIATKAYAAARVEDWDRLPEAIRETAWMDFREAMRAALEAIHVQPLSVEVSDEAVLLAEKDGENALAPWLEEVFSDDTADTITWEQAAKALFDLGAVRPLPTREQIAEALDDHEPDSVIDCTCGWRDDANDEGLRQHQADAVLALMGGAEA